MASSKADCVFGEVRLISSAKIICPMIGPGLKINSCSFGLKMETPVTSEGSKSGVNCIRLKFAPIDFASALDHDRLTYTWNILQ